MKYAENQINGNYSKGRFICPEGIVLHHTGDYSEGSIINTFKDTTSNKSAHVIIWKNGTRTICVEDNLRAWHAGESIFKGRPNCNNFMLGVEFHGDTNKKALTKEQIESFIEWARVKMVKYRIHLDMITDHRTISPGRKVDINPKELKRITDAIKLIS